MNILKNLHLPTLSKGKQDPGSNQVCAEQAINWLVSGRLDLDNETDHPECVQPVLNQLAIVVNDLISDERRHEMWPIILRQPGTSHPEMEPILSVRLACFLANKVLYLVPESNWEVCRDAIVAAENWCNNPCKETSNAADAAAYAVTNVATYAASAANAAYAAAYAADAAATAYAYAYAAASANANAAYAAAYADANAADADNKNDVLLQLLKDTQDECERLTGHIPESCDISRLERLGELVGVVKEY